MSRRCWRAARTGSGQWSLSLLYDVMPFLHRIPEPVMSMAITRANHRQATMANLLRAGKEIAALEVSQAQAEIESVWSTVRGHWRADFEQHAQNVPSSKVAMWASAFEGFSACGASQDDRASQDKPRRDRGPKA